MEYDPEIIQQFAAKLYKKARSLALGYAIIFTLVGVVVGVFAFAANLLATLTTAFLLAVLGYTVGNDKAFMLKLEAQTALAQAQIEKNTRTR